MEHTPWIGERYERGLDERRLLLFGFSHYGANDAGNDDADFTNHVIRSWALDGQIPFFNTLAGYFNRSDAADFLHQVAFANLLPRSVGDKDEMFSEGDEDMQSEVDARVRRLVREIDPDTVIVFTTKGWRLCPPFDDRDKGDWLSVPGHDAVEYGGYRRTRTGCAMAYGLRHPMMASWNMMHAKVAAIMSAPTED